MLRYRWGNIWFVLTAGIIFLCGILFLPAYLPYEPYIVWLKMPDLQSPGLWIILSFFIFMVALTLLDVLVWHIIPEEEATLTECISAGFWEDPYFSWIMPIATAIILEVADKLTGHLLQSYFLSLYAWLNDFLQMHLPKGWALIPAAVITQLYFGGGHIRKSDSRILVILRMVIVPLGGILHIVAVITQGIIFTMIYHSLYDCIYWAIHRVLGKPKV